MNKKEVSEIKKTFKPDNAVITRICGCYVSGEKEIKCTSKYAFHSLSEEESYKYFEIFKRTLSGTIGKNLLNFDFPTSEESKGGKQEFLYRLRNSKLTDDELIDEFYQKIIDSYRCCSNYYIVLIHGEYDVPGKATDGSEMFDASDIVYDYILCSICPVKLSKSALSYDANSNSISERIRDWIVDVPANGFLFPAFNDRNSDVHQTLYFSKNPEELQTEFIEQMIGSDIPLSAGDQKETFNNLISKTIGDDCDFNTIKTIHETLNGMINESKDSPEPLVLTKNEVRKIFEDSKVPNEKINIIEKELSEAVGEKPSFVATNISSGAKFSIETPDVIIKVNPERTDLIETKMIDGRQCLVIKASDRIEVNGIRVRTAPLPQSDEEDLED